SLGAIGITALAGTIAYGALGELEPGAAAIVGLPAALGAVAGTALQQRVASRTLSLGFAALLAAIGVWLLI
ncbi:MAG: sulfite exporter TauE/SafE family protein, partial [Gaiellaceae bacterium]